MRVEDHFLALARISMWVQCWHVISWRSGSSTMMAAGSGGSRYRSRATTMSRAICTHNGGGGSATVYRRFGAGPTHSDPSSAQLTAFDAATRKIAAKEADARKGSMAFAQWWADLSIPQGVKTFAMLSASSSCWRTLSYRRISFREDRQVSSRRRRRAC